MNKILFLFSLLLCNTGFSTNVSGGIYTNTTWTTANSPYIVTDTIVVFPNVTLTIQPGVIVRFADTKYLELRQSSLIALGTISNRIIFTSNTSTNAGSWGQIVRTSGGNHPCRFSYCDFKYADNAFSGSDSLFFKHCNFYKNNIGIKSSCCYLLIDSCSFRNNAVCGLKNINCTLNYCNISNNTIGIDGSTINLYNCVIDSNQTGITNILDSKITNCYISHNQYGVEGNLNGGNVYKYNHIDSNVVLGIHVYDEDTLMYCQIRYNGTGLDAVHQNIVAKNIVEFNTVGIKTGVLTLDNSIYCNRICNNTSYDLQMLFSTNLSLPNNYWCTPDSASTEAVIYDGYDNINLGLINFMPMDNSQCYLSTEINEPLVEQTFFIVYPNPVSDNFTLTNSLPQKDLPATFTILNMTGQIVLQKEINSSTEQIDVSEFSEGIYICSLESKSGEISYRKIAISR